MKPTDLKCRPQVVAVIGEALGDYELGRLIDSAIALDKNAMLDGAFNWIESPQLNEFWNYIDDSKNPYDHGHEKPEVKEWAYIDYTVAGDSKITQWCEVKDKYYMGLNLMVLHESKDVKVLATHKSVTMPDWVSAELDKLDYNPEDVAFNARLPQEDKRTTGIHANTEIFAPESEYRDKVEPSEKLKAAFAKAKDMGLDKPINKYKVQCKGVEIDVYDVLLAYSVTNPADQHAIKKMLMPGKRGVKDANQDRKEAIQSLERAIELASASE